MLIPGRPFVAAGVLRTKGCIRVNRGECYPLELDITVACWIPSFMNKLIKDL